MLHSKVKSMDIERNNSYYSYKESKVVNDIIVQPTIDDPVNNTTIGTHFFENKTLYRGIKVLSSSYIGNGNHTTSEYKICRDIDGLDIIADKIVDGTTCTFTIEELGNLSKEKEYYIFVRYRNEDIWSTWSLPSMIHVTDYIYTRGVLLYRHESNKGTVLRFLNENNKESEMIVVDASLRIFATSQIGFKNKSVGYGINLMATQRHQDIVTRQMYTDSSVGVCRYTPFPDYVNINHIRTYWPQTLGIPSSKFYTDLLISLKNYTDSNGIVGCPPANNARSVSIVHNGITYQCDLPNIYKLLVIFVVSDYIDLLDPTADAYPNIRLGYTNPNGRLTMWSSVQCHDSYDWNAIGFNGCLACYSNSNTLYTIPILELDQI